MARVCVYAICKNEEAFVDRWMDSMSEADEVVVLDTGSEDHTVERLKERGAHVTVEAIRPWRFDVARNRSLDLVPEDTDICVCTDLDEVFHPGWRSLVEQAWEQGARQIRYRYTWSFNEDGSEGFVFWIDKIHMRQQFRWVNPVHEVITYVGEGICPSGFAEGVQLDHHPDPTKSRGQYLPLLELAVRENPHNDRNTHYLGREYMFYQNWTRCIETLRHHLEMPESTWRDERCASMRYIARAYTGLGDDTAAEEWHLKSLGEAPYLREPWLDYALFLYRRENWPGVLYTTGQALAITERPRTYITEADSWGSLPYDLSALGYFHLGQYDTALHQVERAIALAPYDERLRGNRLAIMKTIESGKNES